MLVGALRCVLNSWQGIAFARHTPGGEEQLVQQYDMAAIGCVLHFQQGIVLPARHGTGLEDGALLS
jgi:hypothetical protein